MDLETAKLKIVQLLATCDNGKRNKQFLYDFLNRELKEMYPLALESLIIESSLREENEPVAGIWTEYVILTEYGLEKYQLSVRKVSEYIPRDKDRPPMIRVVGAGGQTIDYVSAPTKRDIWIKFGAICIVGVVGILILVLLTG